jgi:hypothetical protein
LNDEVRGRLRLLGSTMQHYELIGVEWSYPNVASTNVPGPRRLGAYRVRPRTLANAVIEWDRQATDCMGCHQNALTHRVPEDLCDQIGSGLAAGGGAASRIAPAFSTGDFFWGYKSSSE